MILTLTTKLEVSSLAEAGVAIEILTTDSVALNAIVSLLKS